MIKKALFYISLLAISAPSYAQHQMIARFAPFSLLDPVTPTLQIGVEYRFHKRYAFDIDYGLKTSAPWNHNKYDDHYFKIKGEFKLYWHLKKKNWWYAGLAGFYLPENYNRDKGTINYPSELMSYERAHVRRDVSGGLLRLGHVVRISDRLSVDMFAGLGFRLVYTTHSNIEGLGPYDDPGDYVAFIPLEALSYNYDPSEGQNTNIHAELGLKVCYTLFGTDINKSN